jgi:hypothetical protein
VGDELEELGLPPPLETNEPNPPPPQPAASMDISANIAANNIKKSLLIIVIL